MAWKGKLRYEEGHVAMTTRALKRLGGLRKSYPAALESS